MLRVYVRSIFFFNDTATTEIYTLSLHDALPIFDAMRDYYESHNANVHRGIHVLAEEATALYEGARDTVAAFVGADRDEIVLDRKSTRLNSSHANISYAVFCLKKKHQDSR